MIVGMAINEREALYNIADVVMIVVNVWAMNKALFCSAELEEQSEEQDE